MRFRKKRPTADFEEWDYYLMNGIAYRTHFVIASEQRKDQAVVVFRLGIDEQKPTAREDNTECEEVH